MAADHSSQPSPTQKGTKPVAFFFGCPRFRTFKAKDLSETQTVVSPTSILDTIPFCSLGNPFTYDRSQPISAKSSSESKHSWGAKDSKGIGLALIDTLHDGSIEENSFKPSSGKVIFGTKLRVQIPPPLPPSTLSPKSPADFGIKTRNFKLSEFGSPSSGIQTKDSPRVVTVSLSVSEMELSEDYTCVICRGPSPRTTHIFDDCIVETYHSLPGETSSSLENFLSFCFTCKKTLEQTEDIYIYRGEKAFCSHKCRHQEMLLDGVENPDFDHPHEEFS
ncbi:FCS-Like Zinc finger 8-like isoform X2 [Juglans microcarpa x Juglans regia]|uniref:FCS-Like Zinc finger 8-like isoform X2 n=1 Tax=Juglans microcarpa x Juglans regia TaxID=2249226 RepID=UPI001B7DEBE9|nr:FCS-Like Zinc finger 8-like isoform X2 [Juglans microcarpa x Juglans regia]